MQEKTGDASTAHNRSSNDALSFVDASGLDTILNRLVENGWVKQGDGAQGVANFQLTDDGRRHHGIILAAQKHAREKMMQGISEEEYATVIRVLRRIVGNLQQDENTVA